MQVKVNKGIIASYLIALGIVYNTMNGTLSSASTLISLSFILVLLLFINQIYNGNIKRQYFPILFFSIFLVFTNVTLSGGGGFDYYKKAIMYSTTIVWMVYCVNQSLSKNTVILVLIINIAINILYLVFFRRGFSMYEGELLLTLNFPNPNQTGMFLLNSILYICIPIVSGMDLLGKRTQYWVVIGLLIPLLISVSNLLIMTGTRSSFMSLALFAFLVFIDYVSNGHFKLKKWMAFIVSIMPFVFVFIYLSYVGDLSSDISMGIENAGKSNTTRVPIWKPIVDNFAHYFIIGDYYGISNGTGMSQLHNTHLDVYASYGIIPLILYVRLLYMIIVQSIRKSCCRFQRVSLYAFISCMVSCIFEASLVAGSAGMFLLTVGFLAMANSPISHTDSPIVRERKFIIVS